MKTIIEMAREAGGYLAELPNGDAWLFDDAEQMERFAALVRADEREECAKVCEKVAVDYYTRIGREHEPYMRATAEDCARHIRAREQPDEQPWVGLTGQEKELIASVSLDVHDAVHRTDAKLKEKNT